MGFIPIVVESTRFVGEFITRSIDPVSTNETCDSRLLPSAFRLISRSNKVGQVGEFENRDAVRASCEQAP